KLGLLVDGLRAARAGLDQILRGGADVESRDTVRTALRARVRRDDVERVSVETPVTVDADVAGWVRHGQPARLIVLPHRHLVLRGRERAGVAQPRRIGHAAADLLLGGNPAVRGAPYLTVEGVQGDGTDVASALIAGGVGQDLDVVWTSQVPLQIDDRVVRPDRL